MSNTELRVILGGQQVQCILNPNFCPPQGTYLDVPVVKNGVETLQEVYVSKVSTKYPSLRNTKEPTIISCDCVEI
mgnify:CR=1 FL=1